MSKALVGVKVFSDSRGPWAPIFTHAEEDIDDH